MQVEKPIFKIETYQTKPNKKQATQLYDNKENCEDIKRWIQHNSRSHVTVRRWLNRWCLDIETLEGTLTARPGDYIIKGLRGEFYPCKPDIFHKTYEKE